MLANALVPSIAQAIGAQRGQWWLLGAICAVDRSGAAGASAAVRAGDDRQAPAGSSSPSCPFCLSHAGAAALPPSAAAGRLPVQATRFALPDFLERADRASSVWAAARPRGPPSAS